MVNIIMAVFELLIGESKNGGERTSFQIGGVNQGMIKVDGIGYWVDGIEPADPIYCVLCMGFVGKRWEGAIEF